SLVTPASIRAALAPLAATFQSADVVVANYEAATGDVDAKAFRLAYAAPQGWLEELPKAGIKALTVANNHACDLSMEVLDATIAIIDGGDEYVAQRREVMDQARHAADAGADAVIVHHPHIASPVVVHATKDGRKVPVFASVGNLASNQGESWKPSMFPVLRE